jgi:hypothetical protein
MPLKKGQKVNNRHKYDNVPGKPFKTCIHCKVKKYRTTVKRDGKPHAADMYLINDKWVQGSPYCLREQIPLTAI